MAKYRKKPVVIEAIKWTGDNIKEMSQFVVHWKHIDGYLYIPTLEGDMRANEGDYIIRGVKGEYYPCKPDIFHATYEEVSP